MQVLPVFGEVCETVRQQKDSLLGEKTGLPNAGSFGNGNSTNSLNDLVNDFYLPTMYFISLQNIQPAVVAANGFSRYVKDLQPFFHSHSFSCLK
jgi:hypothetical protein